MKILYILKRDPDTTLNTFMEEHKKTHEVTVVDLRKDRDYEKIIDLVATFDKLITW